MKLQIKSLQFKSLGSIEKSLSHLLKFKWTLTLPNLSLQFLITTIFINYIERYENWLNTWTIINKCKKF